MPSRTVRYLGPMRVLALLLMAGGCYQPSPVVGAPCPTGMCPSGQVCDDSENPAVCVVTLRDGGIDPVDAEIDATPIDAAPDAPPPCFGAGAYSVCMYTNGSLTLPNTIDTTNSTLCLATQPSEWTTAGQPDACFIVRTNITVPTMGTVDVTGTRPLVLVAGTTISVTGMLDGSSHSSPVSIGAGSPSPDCPAFVTTPTSNVAGGGGGAGATFTTQGGAGGTGNAGASTAGTAPAASTAPALLRAGCSGQSGADGSVAGSGGLGGRGGGAVYLVAGTSITFANSAVVNVSGAGAASTGKVAGGGGGGSGGMILLHAPTITASVGAKLVANGGGGASGGESGGGGQGGKVGSDPNPGQPLAPAAGGVGPGGNGGDGHAGPTAATSGANGIAGAAGGGGGGGAGYIQSNVALTPAVASPSAVVVP